MLTQKIAAYYYPTNVILIDDNKRYLNTVCFELDEQIAYRLFDTPEKAINYFQQNYKFNPLIHHCLTTSTDANIHLGKQHDVSLNISAIHEQIYNDRRFNEVAVIFVDYNMPNMDGLAFAKQIAQLGLPIKLIMLTAAADERMGLEALNRGDIHQFILKSVPNLSEILNQGIHKLQLSYFEDLSEALIKPLVIDSNTVLNKPAFKEFFYNLCKQQHVAEFYLYDTSGSYLMLDYYGKPIWLVVKSAAELNDYYDLARDSQAPTAVLDALKEGKMLPFFSSAQALGKVKGLEWEKHVYPAKRLIGTDQTFFYSLIENKPELLPEKRAILSHNEYMNRVWPDF